MGGSASSIRMNEYKLIITLSIWNVEVSIKRISLFSKVGNNKFTILSLFSEFFAGNFNGWWSSFLHDPAYNGICGSSTSIVLLFLINEPFKSWESLDSKSFGHFLLLSSVDLSNIHWWIFFGKSFCSRFVFWC